MRCDGCGSIDVVRLRSTELDKFVRLLTGLKRFGCRRCGWNALRAWDETTVGLQPIAQMKPLRIVPRQQREREEVDFSRFA